jgi:hypothetical protein
MSDGIRDINDFNKINAIGRGMEIVEIFFPLKNSP